MDQKVKKENHIFVLTGRAGLTLTPLSEAMKQEQAQPDVFQGYGSPMVMPDFAESVKRTQETLSLIEKEEKRQGLSWTSICRKEANERAKETKNQELSHQRVQETIAKTNNLISEIQCQAIREKTRAQKEFYEKIFREAIDMKKFANEFRRQYYAGET